MLGSPALRKSLLCLSAVKTTSSFPSSPLVRDFFLPSFCILHVFPPGNMRNFMVTVVKGKLDINTVFLGCYPEHVHIMCGFGLMG